MSHYIRLWQAERLPYNRDFQFTDRLPINENSPNPERSSADVSGNPKSRKPHVFARIHLEIEHQ
jgi:hypothetical protein